MCRILGLVGVVFGRNIAGVASVSGGATPTIIPVNESTKKRTFPISVLVATGLAVWTASGFAEPGAAAGAGNASAGGQIVLTAPVDYQVSQRVRGKAEVAVCGRIEPASGKVEAIRVRLVEEGDKAGAWRNLGADLGDAGFRGRIEVPAGGWYRLEVEATVAGQGVLAANVGHVGVGEVFVVAGQSNSANHGEERQVTKSGKVASFDGNRWCLANDPQPGASGGGGSFLPPFGDALVARLGVPVGLVACGIGATSVREWLPPGSKFPQPPTLEGNVRKLPDGQWESKGDIYRGFVNRMKALPPNGFRAVLWHQGESDANQPDAKRSLPGKIYREQLELLIRQSRRDIGWEAPWFVAQVSYHVPTDPGSPEIREAQASLWKDGVALEGPDSDALKGPLREGGGAGVHFSGNGLREHAARWVEKVAPWVERQAK